ncbi:hypothetical protein FVE85_7937 [Porphyridium purpureum]|uniref:Mediator of RNA polymerase II transcription subunit 14 n=1 Tax=Porphyridium purpureum TaxID=35688 RepID=A0A5J4YNC3_PORPP|nr:hypothetical protein FVE85_7937 [Porphyridium purpureum]|eukprot:POR0233..scf295_9
MADTGQATDSPGDGTDPSPSPGPAVVQEPMLPQHDVAPALHMTPLHELVLHAADTSFRELSTWVESEATEHARRENLYNLALVARTRMARALALTRSAMAIYAGAGGAESVPRLQGAAAETRANAARYELAADSLWAATTMGVGNPAMPPLELRAAARILSTGDEPLPSSILQVAQRLSGVVSDAKHGTERDPESRLSERQLELTRRAVRIAGFRNCVIVPQRPLNNQDKLRVAFAKDARYQLCFVDLLLESAHLRADTGVFRLVAITINVRERFAGRASSATLASPELVRSIQDAVQITHHTYHQAQQEQDDRESGTIQTRKRFHAMLSVLQRTLHVDVCAPYAFALVSQQFSELGSHPAWKEHISVSFKSGAVAVDAALEEVEAKKTKIGVQGEEESEQQLLSGIAHSESGHWALQPKTSTSTTKDYISIKYWNKSCELRVRMATEAEILTDGGTSQGIATSPELLKLEHVPPLPVAAMATDRMSSFVYTALNAESVLESVLVVRARHLLAQLRTLVVENPESYCPKSDCRVVQPHGTAAPALRVDVGLAHSGLDFSCVLKSGHLRVRTFGLVSQVVPPPRHSSVGLWSGDKPMLQLMDVSGSSSSGLEHIGELVSDAVRQTRQKVLLELAAHALNMLDVGVSRSLPPGTAAVAAMLVPKGEQGASQIVPPFAPLERLAPRRFLTISPPSGNWKQAQVGIADSDGDGPGTESLLAGSFRPSGSGAPRPGKGGEAGSVSGVPENLRLAGEAHSTRRECSSLVESVLQRKRELSQVEARTQAKRPRFTYATMHDGIIFIQESAFSVHPQAINRYGGDAAAAVAWAVAREASERRLRRDSLLRAFQQASVASAARVPPNVKQYDFDNRHDAREFGCGVESISRTALKVKCEPIPVVHAELILRGTEQWQVRLQLLPRIFDCTNESERRIEKQNELMQRGAGAGVSVGAGMHGVSTGMPSKDATNMNHHGVESSRSDMDGGDVDGPGSEQQRLPYCNTWVPGITCTGSFLTFTYSSANASCVRWFFRDLTCTRTSAALTRGVTRNSKNYRVLCRSPIRLVVGVGLDAVGKHAYEIAIEYAYNRGNTGGFTVTFSPSAPTLDMLGPLMEESLDASGGAIGATLSGMLERAIPVAVALERGLREKVGGRIQFVTVLRVRVVFVGVTQDEQRSMHALDIDAAQSSRGYVSVVDVGRAATMILAQRVHQRAAAAAQAAGAPAGGGGGGGGGGASSASNNNATSRGRLRNDFVAVPRLDELAVRVLGEHGSLPDRVSSQVKVKIERLEELFAAIAQGCGAPVSVAR